MRCCPYCLACFVPSKTHPDQLVCDRPQCQRRRRADYRRAKLAADPDYAERCRQSARQWRKQHPHYWPQYRQDHPASVDGNRQQQQTRDRRRQIRHLANNTLAPAKLWILQALPLHHPAPALLANNTPLDC